MRILLSSLYHISSYTGGNEQYLHQLALGLTQSNNHVYYLTSKAKKGQHYPYTIISHPVPHLFDKPLISKSWQQELTKIKPDLVHCSGSGLALIALAIHARQKQIPTILTYQADTHPTSMLLKLPAMLEHQLISHHFDAFITTTPFYQNRLQQQWPHKKVWFIPMMINPLISNNKLSKSQARKAITWNNQKMVLFIGALSSHQYYKGVEVLIRAAQNLSSEYQIRIIGDGNRRQFYQQQAIDFGVQNKVKFLGYLQDIEIANFLKAADVLVLPSTSDSEGFGLVLIEAMACRTPTITTTAIGSSTWFAKEQVTTLIEPSDPVSLAKTIQKVVNNPNAQQIERAYKFSRQFNISTMTNHTVKLYHQLINHET